MQYFFIDERDVLAIVSFLAYLEDTIVNPDVTAITIQIIQQEKKVEEGIYYSKTLETNQCLIYFSVGPLISLFLSPCFLHLAIYFSHKIYAIFSLSIAALSYQKKKMNMTIIETIFVTTNIHFSPIK